MVNVTKISIIKCLELVIVCILYGLHYHSKEFSDTEILCWTTFGGYLIIFTGLFAGAIMATPVNRRIDLFFSLIGCALFIACGSMIIDYHKNSQGYDSNKYIAKGSISIIEGIILFIDAVLTFRGEA